MIMPALRALIARNPDDWEWGRMHTMDLHNGTLGESGVGLVEELLNRDGFRVGGGGAIVNATTWDAAKGYAVTAAPSMRMVVSLEDFDDSRWINLKGDERVIRKVTLWYEARSIGVGQKARIWLYGRD